MTSTRSPGARRSSATFGRAGRYSAADIDDAGGIGIVIRELLKGGYLDGSAATVTGQTLADIAADVDETPGQDVFRPIERPIKTSGGLAILRGSLAPDGCVIKLAGHERRTFSRPGPGLRLGAGRATRP